MSNNSKKKRISILLLIPVVVIVAGISAFMLMPANVSRAEAAEIALTHIGGGRNNRPDRDFERFQRVWSVEVFYDGWVDEVYVSMRTGEVVEVEISSP
jgi:hypothetical protein